MYLEYTYDTSNPDEELLVTLMKTNHFTESDLQQNRAGRMSSAQMVRMTAKAIGPLLALALPLAGLVALVLTSATVYPYLMTKVRLLLAMSKYVVGFASAIFFGFIALVINFLMHSERVILFVIDLAQGQAATEVGRLTTSKAEEVQDGIDQVLNRKTTTLNYVLKGNYYQVSEEAYDAMLDHSGSLVRIYFTPRSRLLLAAEPARGEA